MTTPDLARYYAFRFVAWLVDYLLLTGVPLLCFKVTGQLSSSGLALALTWAPRILSLGGAGYLVDRLPIRRLCVTGDGVRLAGAVLSAVAIRAWPSAAVGVAVIFSAIAGVVFEQTFVAGEKLGRALADPGQQPRIQATLTGLEQVAVIAAPVVCGALLLFDPVVFMAAVAALYGLSLLCSLALPSDARSPEAASAASRISLSAGLRSVIQDPVLRGVVLLTMGLNYMLGLINGSAAALVADRFGASTSALSFLYAIGNVISILVLGAAPWLIRRFGLWRFGAGAAVLSPVVCALIGVAPALAVFGVCLGAFLALDALFSVYMRTTRAKRVPVAHYGSIVAAFGLLVIIPLPLAGLTLAALGSHAHMTIVLTTAVAGSMLLAAVVIPTVARANADADHEAAGAAARMTPVAEL